MPVNQALPQADRLLLFLDFDGVLHPLAHPTGAGRGRPYAGPMLVQAPLLAALLAPWIDRIDIVITSTWARTRSLDAMRSLLPMSLARQVTGSIWEADAPANSSRFEVINRWRALRCPGATCWIALDDDNRGWPDAMRKHLVWCHAPLNNEAVQTELLGRLVEAFEITDPLSAARGLPSVAVVALVMGLIGRWKLDALQRAQLLGLAEGSAVSSHSDSWTPTAIDCGRRLLGIHAALGLLFPEDCELRWTWIHRRNRALDDQSPLDMMLADNDHSFERVSRLLRSQLCS